MPAIASIGGAFGYGRAVVPNAAPSVTPLAGSLIFNGNAHLTLSNGLAFGSSNYTCETWFFMSNSTWDAPYGFIGGGSNGELGCISIFFNTSSSNTTNTVTTDKYGGGGTRTYNFPINISTNTWNHFAITRNSSQTESAFINGVKAASCSGGINISGGQQTNILDYPGLSKNIGDYYGANWRGYLTNMRVIITSNLYNPTAANITVPNTAPLSNITNTRYLMLGSNITLDSSGIQTVVNTNVTQSSAIKPF